MRYLALFTVVGVVALGKAFAVPDLASAPQLPTSCPAIDQIKKNPQSMKWGVKKDWKSYNISFANHLVKFLGAQWVGVNLGNIFCVYQGDNNTFPVELQYFSLASQPTGGKWIKSNKGYFNCISSSSDDCQFTPYQQPSRGTLYQQLDSLQANPEDQNGF